MTESYRRIFLRPRGLDDTLWSQLGDLLQNAVVRQRASADESPKVLRYIGDLREESETSSYFVDHEPATALTIAVLFDRMAQPLHSAGLIRAAVDVFEALRVFHSPQKGLPTIHGGLCPGTVLVAPDGSLKVTDFGFAPALCSVLGTPGYLNAAVGPSDNSTQTSHVTGAWEVLPVEEIDRDDRLCAFIDPEKFGTRSLAAFEPASDVIAAAFVLHLLAEHQHPYLYLEPDAHRVTAMAECMDMGHFNGARRKDLRESGEPGVQAWCRWIAAALSRLPKDRPTAARLVEELRPYRAIEATPTSCPADAERGGDSAYLPQVGAVENIPASAETQLEMNPGELLAAQVADFNSVVDQLSSRIAAAATKAKLNTVPKRIKKPVDRVVFQIKGRGREAIELPASWDARRGAFMLPTYWQERLEDYLASSEPRSPGLPSRRKRVVWLGIPISLSILAAAWRWSLAPDQCPNDPSKIAPGVCGCGKEDTDSDNDGLADCQDGCPLNPNKQEAGFCGCAMEDSDRDGDKVVDCNDDCPDDPMKHESKGECGCGKADDDRDGDRVADCNDGCPDDSKKSARGVCGCGFPDEDLDGDGTVDCVSAPGAAEFQEIKRQYVELTQELQNRPTRERLMQIVEREEVPRLRQRVLEWKGQLDPSALAGGLAITLDAFRDELAEWGAKLNDFQVATAGAAETIADRIQSLEEADKAFPFANVKEQIAGIQRVASYFEIAKNKRESGDGNAEYYFLNRARKEAEPITIKEIKEAIGNLEAERKRRADEVLNEAESWLDARSLGKPSGEDPITRLARFSESAEARRLLDRLIDTLVETGVEPDSGQTVLFGGATLNERSRSIYIRLRDWTQGSLWLDGGQTPVELSIIPSDPQQGILDPIWMGAREISVAQYQAVMNKLEASIPPGVSDKAYKALLQDQTLPIACIPLSKVTAFISEINRRLEGRATIRLPREEEWRYALSAGAADRTNLLYGNPALIAYEEDGTARIDVRRVNLRSIELRQFETLFNVLIHEDGHGQYAPTGTTAPNRWGLFEMLGNVSELVNRSAMQLPCVMESSFRSTLDSVFRQPEPAKGIAVDEVGFRIVVRVVPP